jgi:hypothetical protein
MGLGDSFMPKRKKKKDVTQMTDDELERHLFPKEVVDEIKRIARESDAQSEPKQKPPKKRSS